MRTEMTKALFILVVSLLVAGFVISSAAVASTSSSDGSSAQRLIYASAPIGTSISKVPAKAKATSTPHLVAASKQASGRSSTSGSNSPIAAKSAS